MHSSFIIYGCSSIGRVAVSKTVGWGFESSHPCKTINKNNMEKIKNFFIDTYKELKKVSWPKRKELLDSTRIVIISMVVFAAIVWVIDQGISKALELIF